jgi:hypothetical protein
MRGTPFYEAALALVASLLVIGCARESPPTAESALEKKISMSIAAKLRVTFGNT